MLSRRLMTAGTNFPTLNTPTSTCGPALPVGRFSRYPPVSLIRTFKTEAAFKWIDTGAAPARTGTSTINRVIPQVHESTRLEVAGACAKHIPTDGHCRCAKCACRRSYRIGCEHGRIGYWRA